MTVRDLTLDVKVKNTANAIAKLNSLDTRFSKLKQKFSSLNFFERARQRRLDFISSEVEKIQNASDKTFKGRFDLKEAFLYERVEKRIAREQERILNRTRYGFRIFSRLIKRAIVTIISSFATLGISIKKTFSEFDKFNKGLKTSSVFSTSDTKTLNRMKGSFQALSNIIGYLRDRIVIALAPAITALINRFRNWLTLNRELIQSRIVRIFENLLSAVSSLAVGFETYGGAILGVIDKLSQFGGVIKGIFALGFLVWTANLINNLKKVAVNLGLLSVVTNLNPILITITAIVSAVTLLITYSEELVALWKKISDYFKSIDFKKFNPFASNNDSIAKFDDIIRDGKFDAMKIFNSNLPISTGNKNAKYNSDNTYNIDVRVDGLDSKNGQQLGNDIYEQIVRGLRDQAEQRELDALGSF